MKAIARSAWGGAVGAAALGLVGGDAHGQDEMTLEQLRAQAVNERIKALEDKFAAPDLFRVHWKDGLRLTTPDGKFDLKIGGRLHFEGQWNCAEERLEETKRYNGSSGDAGVTQNIGPLEDAFEIRRARLYLSGLVYEHIEFKFQYDFAKSAVQDKDVYAGAVDLGDWIPNVRAGHMYEQFGLDSLTSSNDSVFIERAAISNIISPNRNPGFMLWKNFKDGNQEERVTWAGGVFREDASDDAVATGDGAYNLTARVTGTPFWKDKGKQMVHLGVAGTRRGVAGRQSGANGEGVAYAGKPEVDTFGNFVNTGLMREADVDWRFGGELAAIWKAWCFAGEYMITKTDLNATSSALDNPEFHGWYAQVSYVLTGEARRWKPAEAIFQNPRPYANAFDNGGMGAWEAALRYSTIDLTDGHKATGGVEGGELVMLTAGLNWYLNPNTRWMFDVSRIHLDDVDPALGRGGDATVLQTRVQFNF